MKTSRMGTWLLGASTLAAIAANVWLLVGPSIAFGSPDLTAAETAPALPPAAPTATAEPAQPPAPSAEPAVGPIDAKPELDDPTLETAAEEKARAEAPVEAIAEAERLFRRIVKAYESMEPENASAALVQLAERDMYSVVRTLLAMDPRRSGLILDAMSRKVPGTAASVTAEMIAQASPAAFAPAR